MDALTLAPRAYSLDTRAAHVYCSVDRYGRRVCRRETFFHRVGRWILTGILIFAFLVILLTLCCCLKMRKSRAQKHQVVVNNGGAAPSGGLFGMFKKNRTVNEPYNLHTAPNGAYPEQKVGHV